MIRAISAILTLTLAACAGTPDVTRTAPNPMAISVTRSFGPAFVLPNMRSNAEMLRDFERLAFELESGRSLNVLSRFEGPVTVRLTGSIPNATASKDLDALVGRLRAEAGIPISRVAPREAASITVEMVSASAIHRVAPNAACFVTPNVSSWSDFLKSRKSANSDWTLLQERRQMAVFIPSNVSSQEVRDCLHEELAQALGPVNDLYDAHDSVFNDDNFHTILTGFDMDILRLFYAPSLSSGMPKAQVLARLPGILAAQRPNAPLGPTRPDPGLTPQTWRDAIEDALGPGTPDSARAPAARWALEVARSMEWRDNRLGFSLYAVARLHMNTDPDRALSAFTEADRLYSRMPGAEIQLAHISIHAAAFALSNGRFDDAISIVDENLPIATRAQNAGLMSTLLMVKSAALSALGDSKAAEAVRVDSFSWASYAFTSGGEISQRYNEILEMVPQNLRSERQ